MDQVYRKSVEDKYLRLRRLTAELRGKDIELSHVLESKMKIMNEILDIVQGDSESRNPHVIKPDYLSIVREKKAQDSEVSKEQLLSNVQVIFLFLIPIFICYLKSKTFQMSIMYSYNNLRDYNCPFCTNSLLIELKIDIS